MSVNISVKIEKINDICDKIQNVINIISSENIQNDNPVVAMIKSASTLNNDIIDMPGLIGHDDPMDIDKEYDDCSQKDSGSILPSQSEKRKFKNYISLIESDQIDCNKLNIYHYNNFITPKYHYSEKNNDLLVIQTPFIDINKN